MSDRAEYADGGNRTVDDLPDRWREQAELAEEDGEILAAEVYRGTADELEATLEAQEDD